MKNLLDRILFGPKRSQRLMAYADLIKRVAQEVSDERSSKCGHDLMMGLFKGDAVNRYYAWIRYLEEVKEKESHTDTQRDGAWVPAILWKEPKI